MARFIADQRTNYRVPHRLVCALLGVSLAWFYKWWARAQGPCAISGLHTGRDRRRDSVDRAVAVAFKAARGLHGSPRLWADLRDDGWEVSEKTVADSMRRQGLIARRIKRRNGLTRQDKTAAKFPDLLKRDFTAPAPNARWVGDMTEIPTVDEHGRPGPKLYLATVIDLYSRRLLGAATGLHPDAELACSAIRMAFAARGGSDAVNEPGWRDEESKRVIFHTDRGSIGEFNWSSQHLDRGGVGWRVRGSRGRRLRRVRGGSGRRIERCGRQCVPRGGRSRRGRSSASSGV
ncbi:MAG: DDE-type integrase/transposase/recombinase [Micropruina sp.]